MRAREYDIIIIGQGLAGSILAYTLINQGQRVLVMDNTHHGSASSVAAGIINPITGHRLNITDRFEEFYPIAKRCYEHLSASTGLQFWHSIHQTRLIKNKGQFDYLRQRQTEPAYDHLLESVTTPGHSSILGNNRFGDTGFGEISVSNTATVDAPAVLAAVKTWLIDRQAYRAGKISYQSIVGTTTGIQIDNAHTKRLIFCEGYQAIDNPWLEHLPFKLAKGEILSLDTIPSVHNNLLSWGSWLVNSNGHTKLGSNFVWNDLSLTTSQSSKEKLLASLFEHTGLTAAVIDHKVGIRPTTTQRKPFVGAIKSLKGAYCFNGFGSKGCLLIPHYAQLLSQHLLTNKPLPEEITQWI